MKAYPEVNIQNAYLESNNQKIPFETINASKYSLQIRFYNSYRYKDGAEFSKMVIPINGKSTELGPCKLLAEPNMDGFSGRLVFTDEQYDLEALLNQKKVIKLQSNFLNLPLIMGHKIKIRKDFKEYTADLTYDLNVYKNIFDQIDSECDGETEDVKDLVQKGVIDKEGRKFMRFLDDRLMGLENNVKNFSKEEHECHGFYFRKQLWNFIKIAPFMARTNNKPRGYSGDSEMMRMVYANNYEGKSTFAKILHKHPVEHPAAQAVRNRRTFISKMLRSFINDHTNDSQPRTKILSVACGPAYELTDSILTAEDTKRYHFTLLDQDRFALNEAKQLINVIEKKLETKIMVDYLNGSVRTMLNTPQLKNEWGQFHFIYSMGLFDYLTPPVAKAVLAKLYQLLEPGGVMVIGNFHKDNPSQTYMEYWLDWVLYYRSETEFKDLIDYPDMKKTVSFDDTGVQMFLHIKNNANNASRSLLRD